MSDPPFPISPLATTSTTTPTPTTPVSPSPKAVNARTFWRDIVRRVSRLPSTQSPPLSTPTPTPTPTTTTTTTTTTPTEPPSTKLVEINPSKREQNDAARRQHTHPVNASAFDDLPPAEVYDPTWNTNPLRGEAGRLGSRAHGPNASVLPVAFTIKSSDLEDDDDDDTDDYNNSHTNTFMSPPEPPAPPPSRLPHRRAPNHPATSVPPMEDPRTTPRDLRPRRSMAWRKQNPATPLVKSRSTMKKPHTFESPTTLKSTTDHLLTVLRAHLQAEIVSIKNTEIRARVPIRVKDSYPTNVVIVSIDARANSCRVSVRRSFADSFRISADEFDTFCSDLQRRFREVQKIASTS